MSRLLLAATCVIVYGSIIINSAADYLPINDYDIIMYLGCWCILNTESKLEYDINIGPNNITRRIGDKNVFIPCPFAGPYLPLWMINNVKYELYSIPDDFVPSLYGLLIPEVSVSLNQTQFRCIISTGHSNDVHISTLGILTVERK